MPLPHPQHQDSVLPGTTHSPLRDGEWSRYTNALLAVRGSELLFASDLAAQLNQCLICKGSFQDCAPQTAASTRLLEYQNGTRGREEGNFLSQLISQTGCIKKIMFLKQLLPNPSQFEGLGKKKKSWPESSSITLSSIKWSQKQQYFFLSFYFLFPLDSHSTATLLCMHTHLCAHTYTYMFCTANIIICLINTLHLTALHQGKVQTEASFSRTHQ